MNKTHRYHEMFTTAMLSFAVSRARPSGVRLHEQSVDQAVQKHRLEPLAIVIIVDPA